MNFLAIDIEISNVFDLRPGENIEKYAPFDISVAATHCAGDARRLWHSTDLGGKPATNIIREHARELLDYLEHQQQTGHDIVAWNGLSFDLKWIGHVAGNREKAASVARKMYDPMFQFFKMKGFPIGLAAVAKAMGIKTRKLMESADAPVQWQAGNHSVVFDYVLADAVMAWEIAMAIDARKQIAWITQKGTKSTVPVPRLRTVEECLRDPMPDQSWMASRIPQKQFAGWVT